MKFHCDLFQNYWDKDEENVCVWYWGIDRSCSESYRKESCNESYQVFDWGDTFK